MIKIFEYIKIIIVITILIFFSVQRTLSPEWIVTCIIIDFVFLLYIPGQQYFMLIFIIPLVITIFAIQLITGILSSNIQYDILLLTAIKIISISITIISMRFFAGRNGLKSIINISPQSLKLFILLFYRILFQLLKLNKLIVFQLQSRINLKSKQKYLIPRYYSIAFITNQFYAYNNYYHGILSRNINNIPRLIINNKVSYKDIISIVILICFIIINIYCYIL